MTKTLLFAFLCVFLATASRAQTIRQEFDSARFVNLLETANNLVEYEYFQQSALDSLSRKMDISASEWFSYYANNTWHTVGGTLSNHVYKITKHVIHDSLNIINAYTGKCDSLKLEASGLALSTANTDFQSIRDTCNFYLSSFVYINPDQTISIWYLPAFQPSGQAVYGCEWEYVFDRTGKFLLHKNSFISRVTGVWIGQPRELWLNYRNAGEPTIGSLFFALSFRDYFTRVRIDTRTCTNTTSKETNGNYSWIHKLK
jgi:hypothetical protein